VAGVPPGAGGRRRWQVTAAARSRSGAVYPCACGCGRKLSLTSLQVVTANGDAYHPQCEIPEEGPRAAFGGVCPECAGELREWRPGAFHCVGAGSAGPPPNRGCGFAWPTILAAPVNP
jgi:hypothetical protein